MPRRNVMAVATALTILSAASAFAESEKPGEPKPAAIIPAGTGIFDVDGTTSPLPDLLEAGKSSCSGSGPTSGPEPPCWSNEGRGALTRAGCHPSRRLCLKPNTTGPAAGGRGRQTHALHVMHDVARMPAPGPARTASRQTETGPQSCHPPSLITLGNPGRGCPPCNVGIEPAASARGPSGLHPRTPLFDSVSSPSSIRRQGSPARQWLS